jgi:hypothetical protein
MRQQTRTGLVRERIPTVKPICYTVLMAIDNKPRQLPKEEVFEVGLAHKRKPKPAKNSWLIEHAGWLVGLAILVLFLVPFGILKVHKRGDLATLTPDAPRLGVVFGPIKIYAEGSETQLREVQVKVGNSGSSVAEGVWVLAVTPNKSTPLTGAKSLEPGKAEVYRGFVEDKLIPGQDIVIKLGCNTCAG